jgi:hypothetical protein
MPFANVLNSRKIERLDARAERLLEFRDPFDEPFAILWPLGTILEVDGTGQQDHAVASVRPRVPLKGLADFLLDSHSLLLERLQSYIRHVLPPGLQRIRYYGLLGNRYREEKLAQCRSLLQVNGTTPEKADAGAPADYRERYEALTGVSLQSCPICRRGRMMIIEQLPPCKAPEPTHILDTS